MLTRMFLQSLIVLENQLNHLNFSAAKANFLKHLSPIPIFRHNSISTTSCNLSTTNMPPVVNGDDPSAAVAQLIKDNSVMVFSKTTCPFCTKMKTVFKQNRIDFTAVEFDTMGPMGADMQKALHDLSGQKSVPNLFINGKHIGMFQIVANIYSQQQKFDLG